MTIRPDQSAAVLGHLNTKRAVVTPSQAGGDQSELLHRQPACPHVARSTHAVALALQFHLLPHRLYRNVT